MKDFERQMRRWGRFLLASMDYADEFGENILHRCAIFQGRDGGPEDGHKVLCADYPAGSKVWEIERAVKRLPNRQEKIVRVWYAAPVKENGNLHTKRELALGLGVSFDRFRDDLQNARKTLRRVLDTD